VWMVAITPAGVAKAAAVGEIDAVLRSELRSGITREERQRLAAVLVRLQSNVAVAVRGAGHTAHPPTTNNMNEERP
jgi:hypothetical protein